MLSAKTELFTVKYHLMINKICIKVEQIHNYGSFSGFIFKNIFGLPSSMHIQSIDLITYWRLITFLIGR